MMLIGIVLLAVGMCALPFVEYMPAHLQRSWLLITRGMSYLGLGVFQIGGTPFLMGATQPEERNHAYALHTAIGPLAGLAGGLVGGLLPTAFASLFDLTLTDTIPYRLTLWVAALVVIPGIFAVRATRNVSSEQTRPDRPTDPTYRLIFVFIFLSGFFQLAGERVARTYFNVYMDLDFHASPGLIGTYWAAGHCISVAAALFSPYLCRKWGIVNVVLIGAFGMVTSLLFLSWFPNPLVAGIAFMGIIAFAAIRRPAYTVHHQELVTPVWRPAMAGATSFSAGSSESTMAILGGYTITSLGFSSLFQTGALMTAFGAILFWFYFRHPRGARIQP